MQLCASPDVKQNGRNAFSIVRATHRAHSPARPVSPSAHHGAGVAAAGAASDDSLDGFAVGTDAHSHARLASLEHALTTVLQVMIVVVMVLRCFMAA